MNNKIKFALALLFFAIFAPMIISAEPKDTSPGFGVILPLSGDFARYGQRVQAGLEKGASGRFSLEFEDEGCEPAPAMTAFHKLVSTNHVRLILGPWCGSPQTAVAPLLKKHDSYAIVSTPSSERLSELSHGRVLSVSHSIEQESKLLAEEANRRGLKRVAVLFFENDFSRAHEAAFRAHYSGDAPPSFAISSNDQGALRSALLKIKQLAPQALYVPDAWPFMHGLLNTMRKMGFSEEFPIFAVSSFQSDDVLNVATEASSAVIYVYPKLEGDADYLDAYAVQAAEMIAKEYSVCAGEAGCIFSKIMEGYPFNAEGVLSRELMLKTVRAGKFVSLPAQSKQN